MESRGRYLGMLTVVLIVAQLALFVSAQECLLAAGGRETPFRKLNRRAPRLAQAIITSYNFRCCGNITAWQTYIQPRGGRHQGAYDITFQVWRPSPTVQENGCYSMVGENRFTSISLLKGGLVSETPEPSNILTVQPGDVVGYYLLSRRDKGGGISLDDSLSVDSVWYDIINGSELLHAGPLNCPLPLGTENGRILTSSTNAAPVLSVNMSSFTCPPTPTILRSSSSSSLPPSFSSSLLPSSSSSLPPSKIATTTSVLTQPSKTIPQSPPTPTPFQSHTSITSPVLSVSISISPTASITEGSAALSTAVIASVAAVGVSALLLTLLSILLLAITMAKVQHKSSAETSSIVNNHQVHRLSMEMQQNEAYTLTSNANTINTESNVAYEVIRMKGNKVTTPFPHGFDQFQRPESHIYELVNTK